MSTTNLGLFKYDSTNDKNKTFNIDKGLNENWDKIDKDSRKKDDKLDSLEKNKLSKDDFNSFENEITKQVNNIHDNLGNIDVPVRSVNEQTGDIILNAAAIKTEDDKNLEEFKQETIKFQEDTKSSLSDIMTESIPFVVATGNNNYIITLETSYESYKDGMRISVAIPTDSTSNTTLNINNWGVISIKKANGNNVTNLKANGVYTFAYYNGNFILQGEGGEYGTATPDKVLSGYSIGTENGIVNGSMVNNRAVVLTPEQGYVTIPEGYHNGSGYVIGDNDMIPENIKKGVSIFGISGKLTSLDLKAGDIITAKDTIEHEQRLLGIYPIGKRFTVNYSGSIRFTFNLKNHDRYGNTSWGRVYKNGEPIGKLRSNDSMYYKKFSEDFLCEEGDCFQLYTEGDHKTHVVTNCIYISTKMKDLINEN